MELTPSCFEIVKDCLDNLYGKIHAANVWEKDQLILRELKNLSDCYEGGVLDNNRDGIDYSRPETRFAYMYTYVASHANIIYEIILNNPELAEIFTQREVEVSSLGIGPGSDIIGIYKYWEDQQQRFWLRLSLHDRETAWNGSWPFLDADIKIKKLDVTARPLMTSKTLYQADLITMVYFLSEVHANRHKASDFFEDLFYNMKAGATVLFIDSHGSGAASWFDKLTRYSLHCLEGKDNYSFRMGMEEQKTDLGEYYNKFFTNQPEEKKRYPKLSAKIAYRLCRKL